jgi:CHAT domain-containing protein
VEYLNRAAFILLACCSSSLPQHAPAERAAAPTSVNRRLHRQAVKIFKLYSAGRYVEAISYYREAASQAEQAGDLFFTRKFLNNLGACQIAIFQFRDALNTLEHARAVSETSRDPQFLADINLNISSLFLQLGDVESSAVAAERGMAYLGGTAVPDARAKLLIQLATVRARQMDMPAAERLFAQAIDAAYDARDPATAALGWEFLGSEYLTAGRVADADRVLTESFRLRALFKLPKAAAYWQLALVRAQQGEMEAARVLIDNAILALKQPGNMAAPWNIYCARGRIRLLSADSDGALSDLRMARNMARTWRAGIVANDASRTAAESGLSALFYSALVQAGNQLYTRTHNPSLERETFEAVEENRAASLRALAAKGDAWRSRLPAHYWELLSRLQAEETRVFQQGSAQARRAAVGTRTELDRLEALAGSCATIDNSRALSRAQHALDANSVLLSFHLGEPDSWMWAVTRRGFAVYRLPAKSKIVPAIRSFEASVRHNAPDAARSGAALYQILFASASPGMLAPERWLLALDDDLFNLPFAALVPELRSGRPVYLAERHALQVAPGGALMLSESRPAPRGWESFLGVGDPIYNRADSRWHEPSGGAISALKFLEFPGATASASSTPGFARLWGSDREIHSAAEVWSGGRKVLLTGADANKARLWSEMATHPAIVHFATHILEARKTLNTGWIALTLNRGGQPEFIQPAEISARSVPARLVVLSGCSSGSAEIRTASGLMGLTRAFMAAGAGSVLATRWPALDDRGSFLTAFYRHLRDSPSGGPSEALRQAQIEAIRAGGWRAQPGFWSSYFLTGN